MRGAFAHLFHGSIDASYVADVFFIPHRLFGDAERFAKQSFVEDAYVESAARRAVFQLVQLVADGGADDAAVAAGRPGSLEFIGRGDFATSKSAAAAVRNLVGSTPLTRRWVARIFNPGECMLTKAMIMRLAPGRCGWSRWKAMAVS